MISVNTKSAKFMLYAMIVTLIIAFGAIGAVLASKMGTQYTLMGFFAGSAFGTFISVYESTIVGCIAGMLVGLIISPLTCSLIDMETSCLMIFTLSLLGAIVGEPIAQFWREAVDNSEQDEDEKNEEDIA